ncbi:MAG: hypothetical protein Q8R24_09485 [Legionellaceae bacterium]|nr:hypothetical protein [Legionellaceae bacterium]
MRRYTIYLSSNGDRFKCAISEHALSVQEIENLKNQLDEDEELAPTTIGSLEKENENFYLVFSVYKNITSYHSSLSQKKIKYSLPLEEIPECIKQALLCKTRNDVISYINSYLLDLKPVEGQENKYYISNSNKTVGQISLFHEHFFETNIDLQGHSSICGEAHPETADTMLSFISNRNSFFEKNYQKGQEYQKTALLNPLWLVLLMGYFLSSARNSLSQTFIGAFILGIESTHFCEDFDLGYENARNRINL